MGQYRDGDEVYPNIRDVPGVKDVIGTCVLDITQDDNDRDEGRYVQILFDNGMYLRFWVDGKREGFHIGDG